MGEEQIMTAIISPTIRGIINRVNEVGVKKEEIVSLIKEGDQFILVYYA